MVNIISDVCKYIIIILVVWYTIGAFTALQKRDRKELKWIYYRQNVLTFLLHGTGYLVIILNEKSLDFVIFYAAQVIFFVIYLLLYRSIYKKSSMILLNHMMFFLAIGFIMLARLSFEKVTRQFVFACIAAIVTLVVPRMFSKLKAARRWAMVVGIVGILALAAVLVLGEVEYGAKLSIQLPGDFSIQPSEFVKISFVLLMAVLFRERTDIKRVLFATGVAGAHIIVLVLSRDLGAALIYCMTYLCMLYVASKKPLYFAGGLGLGACAAVAAYFLFSHVQTRVEAWLDPWPIFSSKGNQIGNSLFGIATGGWMGQGLYQGYPKLIPVVDSDFIFAGISEEMGGIVALCIILICLSCLIMFITVSIDLYIPFYKLTGLGLAVVTERRYF